ncbi:AIG2 family protein [Carbonactinospora thermoautotrophica]|uniref:AIG2 family protein n=1 Tax=Carbonactinospora thermoautotrophica TaxID=1469144 RepID=A0A132MZ87_9ACTN|nr:AIG2 family protein [Carbonactinospora thermoautotrophica]
MSGERSVNGFLITGLSASEWRILDAFEDDSYDLRRLTLTDGRDGWAYVWTNEAEVSADDWDPEQFAARELSAYVERCTAWRRNYDASMKGGHC